MLYQFWNNHPYIEESIKLGYSIPITILHFESFGEAAVFKPNQYFRRNISEFLHKESFEFKGYHRLWVIHWNH
jgi:hypothetical protein